MALFSITIRPSPTPCLALRRFCPPSSATRTQCLFRHPFPLSQAPAHISCQPRASLSGSDPQSSDGEDFFQQSDESPVDDPDSPPETTILGLGSSLSSSVSPDNTVAALQSERDRKQDDLRETLDTLSRSLELLTSTLSEITSAVRELSTALGYAQLQAASSPVDAGYRSPSGLRDERESEATEGIRPPVDPPEPWDNAASAKGMAGSGGPVDDVIGRSEEDTIPSYLVEQNERAHKLAYRLQQAFVEARIEGLGKPFQVAAEDFVQACMEAHGLGIGLKELQLQLVLQDGSLTGAFSIRNQIWSEDPILNEESRIRSLWVRLVYSTLAQQRPAYTEEEVVDPIDSFVKQVLRLAYEEGYDLERLKLEQAFSGAEVASGAVKAMRENQYLILLSLEKLKSQSK